MLSPPSIMLSPPKPLDEIQPNLVCELLTSMARATSFFLAPPPGERSKDQISFNFNYKVDFKDFLFQTLCVCSHKCKIQNISDRFFILSPGSCPRGATWGYFRAKIKFRPAICPLCYLLLNHWTKFHPNLVFVCVLLMNGVRNVNIFWPHHLGPWGEVKNHLISITKSISKIFIPNFACVLTNEFTKHIGRVFHSVAWVMP